MSRKILPVIFIFLLFISILPGQIIDQEELLRFHQYLQRVETPSTHRIIKPAETYPGAAALNVSYYRLDLNILIQQQEIIGAVTIKGNIQQDSVALLSFDLSSSFSVDSIAGDISSFEHSGDEVVIALAETLNSTDQLELTIFYHGSPPAYNTGFFWSEVEGRTLVSTLSEPYFARTWWPCKDVPQDKADSVDVIVTIDDSTLFCVSNGILVSDQTNSDGTRTFHWKERYPITTYLVSLAISSYVHWRDWYYFDNDSMPVEYWVIPEHRRAALETFPLTPEMIGIYASLWDEYPFIEEKYAMAEFSWGGGMEHQTATSVGYSYYWGFGELLIAHELAHQWWGDMVTCRTWGHIWVNEGFARYAEALYYEQKYGNDIFKNYMAAINRPSYWRQTSIFVQDTSSFNNIFDLLVYDKGAWVLHMLRHVVGDSNFFQAYHLYRQNQYMGTATTEDYQQAVESVAGMNLDWFFQEWIYGVGQPTYYYSWEKNYLNSSWNVTLTISQENQYGDEVFTMPIDLLIIFDGGDSLTTTIYDSLPVQTFSFTFDDEPQNLELDPENWVLKNGAFLGISEESQSLPVQIHINPAYPNPFNSRTTISFHLPEKETVSFYIINLKGETLGKIYQGVFPEGTYSFNWDGRIAARELPSGVYFLMMKTGNSYHFSKLTLLK